MAQTLAGQWDAHPSCSIPGEGSPDVEQRYGSVQVLHMAIPGVRCPLPQPLVWTRGMREGQGLTAAESFAWGRAAG